MFSTTFDVSEFTYRLTLGYFRSKTSGKSRMSAKKTMSHHYFVPGAKTWWWGGASRVALSKVAKSRDKISRFFMLRIKLWGFVGGIWSFRFDTYFDVFSSADMDTRWSPGATPSTSLGGGTTKLPAMFFTGQAPSFAFHIICVKS